MKQNSFTAFLLQLFGLSAILYGGLFVVFTKVSVTPGIPLGLMFLMLFCITAISHFILLNAGRKNPQAFTYSFMATSMVRLVIYGIFIVLYGYKHPDIAKVFAITFFALYIIYTVFEIRSVLGSLKGK
ncbi:MAG TPA: hypothetical protein VK890_10715 [Bacteroidia bacterium]|jgi:hypothetical protein|nr:hypothetical protein [Bacteroidia bacterium]